MSTPPSPLAVDIVVTNHNYGAFVCEAVESALAQDHPRTRVVVVDDGSTDQSRAKLRRYEGAVELVLKPNGGQPAAVNAGFARCTGDVVMFLDADDLLAPGIAAHAAAALGRRVDAARVQFRMSLIDARGQPLGAMSPRAHRPLPRGDLRTAELSFPFDLNWAPGGGTAYRTELLRRIMPIPEPAYGRWGADYYLVHLSALLGPVVAIEEVGAYYRVHGANAFEPSARELALDRIRREIAYQQSTLAELARLADELGLERPDEIVSLSNVISRMISFKLAPGQHPVAGEGYRRLMLAALRAARRRADVSVAMRVLLLGAVCALAASPAPLARSLARLLVFPELRPRGTRLLARMHRDRPQPDQPVEA
jgi:GT2 family glycosyltransferase